VGLDELLGLLDCGHHLLLARPQALLFILGQIEDLIGIFYPPET